MTEFKNHPPKTELTMNNSILDWIKNQFAIDTANFPNILAIFDKTLKLKSVSEPHIGLLSSDNIKTESISNNSIVGIWLQAIDSTTEANSGRVAKHHHGDEGISEIIILDDKACYANLPDPIFRVGKHAVHLVEPGVEHGCDDSPSYGRWISIKIKTQI